MRLFSRCLDSLAMSVFGLTCCAGTLMAQDSAVPPSPAGAPASGSPMIVAEPSFRPENGLSVENGVIPENMETGESSESSVSSVEGTSSGIGGGLSAGVAAYFMKPYFESNRAFSRTTILPNGTTDFTSTDFNYGLSASPRVWLGYTIADGWGVRIGAWFFDQKETVGADLTPADVLAGGAFTSASPGGLALSSPPGTLNSGVGTEVLTTSTRLTTAILDIEATKAFDAGCAHLVFGAGARVAWIEQDYHASLTNTANDPAGTSQSFYLNNTQRFVGAGPLLSLEAHYPIGLGGLGVYGVGRGALLAGQYTNNSEVTDKTIVGGVAVAPAPLSSSAPHYGLVPAGELELGIEWQGTGRALRPVIQLGVVAHSYGDVLNNNNSGAAPNTSSLNGALSFFGFTAAAGINY